MPHRLVAIVLAVVAAVAVVLALTVTPWALLALPFCLVGGTAAWQGVSGEAFLAATGDDDAGRGVPGLLP